jgi:hypothetical protein
MVKSIQFKVKTNNTESTLSNAIKSIDSKLDRVAINLGSDGKSTVNVGLPKDSSPYPDGTSVIEVGTIHEFGLGFVHQRSYLRTTIIGNKNKYLGIIKKLSMRLANTEIDLNTALNKLGLIVSNDVKDKITDIKEPKVTSRKPKTEGGAVNPLVDTGHLRQSITYEVATNGD